MRQLIIILAALMFVAPAHAQIDNPSESTPTTLYYHVFDVFNKFVINTQAMNASFFEVGGTNFPSIPATPVVAENGWDFNTIYGTSTAGPVEYDFIENGRPRFHPEPGIAQTVAIDAAVQPVSTLYFEAPALTGGAGMPGVLPYLTVEVTMRTGDDPGADEKLDLGELIMNGKTTVHVVSNNGAVPAQEVASALPLDYPTAMPDETGIIAIEVPMDLARNDIPKTEAFNIRIDWYQASDSPLGADPDTYAQGNFKLVSDPDHLPRLDFAITNPVYIEFIHPQVAAGTLLIHTGVNSPWGTYDVNVDDIKLTVDGPSTPGRLQQVVAQNQHVHGLHDKAAEVTYLWKFRDEGASDGDYTITMEVANNAGTAVAKGTAGFSIAGREAYGIADTGQVVEPTVVDEKESPGPAMVVLGLLIIAVAGRRRN